MIVRDVTCIQADAVFVSMDSMVGPDYEAGLKNLKALAEK
jgi:hypothetical protein